MEYIAITYGCQKCKETERSQIIKDNYIYGWSAVEKMDCQRSCSIIIQKQGQENAVRFLDGNYLVERLKNGKYNRNYGRIEYGDWDGWADWSDRVHLSKGINAKIRMYKNDHLRMYKITL